MNNKIKIIIEHIIFVIIFVLLLTGCGAQLPIDNGEIALNGIAYTYYSEFSYENDVYRIYCIENENLQLLNGNIIYIYDEYNIEDYDSSINLWTINYLKNNKYYIYNSLNNISNNQMSSAFMNQIKEIVQKELNNYEQKLNITFELYNDEEKIEQEFTINNIDNYTKIYILDMYIPFVLNDVYTNEMYTILIPIKTILGYEEQNKMNFVYSKDNITTFNYDNFEFKNSIVERKK